MDEIINALRAILDEEAKYSPDWEVVKNISNEAVSYINSAGIIREIPSDIYQFLDDYDVRMKDDEYAEWQREKVISYLNK